MSGNRTDEFYRATGGGVRHAGGRQVSDLDGCEHQDLPLWDGLRRYVDQGHVPGGFLTALLSNDLVESFGRADDNNRRQLGRYVNHLYNCEPSGCWGSIEKMEEWMRDIALRAGVNG